MNRENRGPHTLVKSVAAGLVCSLVVAATGFVSTDVEADASHCSLELDDKKRKACFEANPQQRFEQRLPGWPILNFRSYASGNPNASVTRIAEEQVMCSGTEGTTSMGLHCVDDGMKVVFSMGCSFGNSNTPTTLELHTDAKSSDWKAKVHRNQLGMSIEDSILASKFIKSMQGHDNVVLVFAPSGAPRFAATFKLEGFDKAVKHIEELCPI